MEWLKRIVIPRPGDGVVLLAGLFLLACAVLPSTFLIDWKVIPFRYDDLAGPVSTYAVGVLAGLANAFSAWLVFGRASVGKQLLATVSLATVALGSFWFGVRCAAFDPWRCEETAALRWLPVFWLVSLAAFGVARLGRFFAVRLKSPSDRPHRRSPIVWLGIPAAVLLWLIHAAGQSGLIQIDPESLPLPRRLELLAAPLVFFSVVPALILVFFSHRWLRSLILIAYFIALSFAGILMEFQGQFEVSFAYGLSFLLGLFSSRWFYLEGSKTSAAPVVAQANSRRPRPSVSGVSIAVVVALLGFSGWFLHKYDLISLFSINSPQRWPIAELNRGFPNEVRTEKPYSMNLLLIVDIDPRSSRITIDRKLSEREWDLISKLKLPRWSHVSISVGDIPPAASLPQGVHYISLSKCTLGPNVLKILANASWLSYREMNITGEHFQLVNNSQNITGLDFVKCNFSDDAIQEMVRLPRLGELRIYDGGKLWSQIAALERPNRPFTIHYYGEDANPREQIRLEREMGITVVPPPSTWRFQIDADRDTNGIVQWESWAPSIAKNERGDVIKLDLTGIELEGKGVLAISKLAALEWLGVSTHDRLIRFQSNIVPIDYSPIRNLTSLRHLRIEDIGFRDFQMEPERIADEKSLLGIAANLPSIESMEIELTLGSLGRLSLRVLPGCRSLQKLTLKCDELELADIKGIFALPNLKELVICSTNESLLIDAEMDALQKLAPQLNVRRVRVGRYEWPADGDKVEESK